MEDTVNLDVQDLQIVTGGGIPDVPADGDRVRFGVLACPYCGYTTINEKAVRDHILVCPRKP